MWPEPAGLWVLDAKEFAAPGAGAAVGPDAAPDPERFSLHRALAPLLLAGQCFAAMPVRGVAAPSAEALRFRWASGRVLYALVAVAASALMTACSAVRLMRAGLSFPRSSATVFCGTHVAAAALLLELARAWPRLGRAWAATERGLSARYGPLPSLPRSVRLLAGLVLLAALAEHALSNAMDALRWRRLCAAEAGGWLRAFAVHSYAPLAVFGYPGAWAVPPFAAIVLIETFCWSYVDVLLMVLSVALSARFRQLNRRLRALRGLRVPEPVWRQLREDYNALAALTKRVDGAVSKLVLLSFGNNLYFICLQLLHSMKPAQRDDGLAGAVYFYWSFGYLLLKTCAVSLCAADIFESARRPKDVLYDVPADSYSVEVQRFLTQVATDDVVLTGLSFFSVTRTLLLTVAGTIVTYEIVLVQFNNLGEDLSPSNNVSVSLADLCLGEAMLP